MADSSHVQCVLLGGTFAYLIQLFIGVVAMSTLVYKRNVTEHPRRPLDIWLMDVSKQLVSSVIIHVWNIGLSILFASLNASYNDDKTDDYDDNAEGGSSIVNEEGDECAFYFLNFLFDTIFGVFLVFLMIKASGNIAVYFNMPSIQKQGFYGFPPQIKWYLHQLAVFIFIILISKFILGIFMYSMADQLSALGDWLFSPLDSNPSAELVVVMVVCPAFLSMVQYWLQDNFLMGSKDVVGHDYDQLDSQDFLDKGEAYKVRMQDL